jgi:hypothetical protein
MKRTDILGLLELLEVNRERIPWKAEKPTDFVERCWQEAGRPTEPKPLEAFLDQVLKRCGVVGYRYPKVLLLRLKQLQRGDWAPSLGAASELEARK